jgi:hypothetical protein
LHCDIYGGIGFSEISDRSSGPPRLQAPTTGSLLLLLLNKSLAKLLGYR